ncbi:hypothetical protein [Bordetella bronchiseptica]|uniref:hypothetical protein n=1 Tax=Bordetella bronchiseptica TaxID=518 RepID=UPI00403C4B9E
MNNELPIHICKANAELQLQILRLFQQSSEQWFETMQQRQVNSIQETASRIQGLQQATDWQMLASLPPAAFWRLTEGRVGDAQAFGHAITRSQAALSDGLRQAIVTWQEAVSSAIGNDNDAADFNQYCMRWMQPWATPSTASQGKAKKQGQE